jgi:hypothetical protein
MAERLAPKNYDNANAQATGSACRNSPGHSGNGKKRGELNGLGFHHQSVAIQGSTESLANTEA